MEIVKFKYPLSSHPDRGCECIVLGRVYPWVIDDDRVCCVVFKERRVTLSWFGESFARNNVISSRSVRSEEVFRMLYGKIFEKPNDFIFGRSLAMAEAHKRFCKRMVEMFWVFLGSIISGANFKEKIRYVRGLECHMFRHVSMFVYGSINYIDKDLLSMLIINEEFRRKKVLCIERIWWNVVSNPEYVMCRNRLMREFNSMKSYH